MLRAFSRTVPPLAVLLLFVFALTSYLTLQARPGPRAPGAAELWPETGAWARQQLARLTLEQKVAQLFSVRAYSFYTSEDDPTYRRLVDFVERFDIGGFCFFQGDPMAQAVLINDLQRRARLPLLIGQDMEWGPGMRLERTTTFPRTMALGATRDPGLAYAAGFVTAQEARALGTHQVFAPVADINNNPENPVINTRSFAEDPQLVAELAAAFARGVRDGGVIATAKHFPGHGDTATDSHLDLPVLPFDRARLGEVELVPFRRLVQEGIQSVMTGHLALPQVEPDARVPATLSPSVTTTILRESLDFQGLVVTDALDMRGVTKHFHTGEAAVRALLAGADLLLLSEDPYAARTAILEAVRQGRLTEKRIDEAALRVLQAKEWVGVDRRRLVDLDAVRATVATSDHLALAHTIARRALTLLRNEGPLLPLAPGARPLLNVILSDTDDPAVGAPFAAALQAASEGAAVTTIRLDSGADSTDYQVVLDAARFADVVVVPAFTAVRAGRVGLPEPQRRLVDSLVAAGKPVALVSFTNPYVAVGLARQPAVYLAAYSAGEASQQAAADALFGRATVDGRLPITLPGLYAYGTGLHVEQGWLRPGEPAEAGLDAHTLRGVDTLVTGAIARRAFPGAAVAVGRNGVLAHLQGYGYHTYTSEQAVTPASSFDLASLTKVVATTTAVMKLYEEGKLRLDDPVVRYFPAFGQNGKERVTLRHLLTHTSGLIAFRPFHTEGVLTREAVLDSIMAERLQTPPGAESRYSDFNMILTGLIVEQITGRPFADYVRESVFEPLGMHATGFRATGTPDTAVVPTEVDRLFRHRLLQGEVHDETAWLLGGTAGHAGLFSTAADLARFAFMLTNEGRVGGRAYLRPETIRLFTTAVDPDRHTRALGWDTRSDDKNSSAGRYFGPRSFGHTGFTGTSLWIDPDADLFVILLANRVYPTRESRAYVPVRPALADLVHRAIRPNPFPAPR